MSGIQEIKSRMHSVQETQKITNAMYLISSAKLRKVKAELLETRPYFSALQKEIRRIFVLDPKIKNRYFFASKSKDVSRKGLSGILVITADKGLAGAYNQNVFNEALKLTEAEPEFELYMVGSFGRAYAEGHHIPIKKSFLYTAQNPTLHRTREICHELLDAYIGGHLKKIYIVYTDYKNGMAMQVKTARLLPLHRKDFMDIRGEEAKTKAFPFEPSMEAVLENLIPPYLTGFVYSALIDSFCSEQNARMSAMDAANQNAENLLKALENEYHHERQSAITREITEISAGAKSLRAREPFEEASEEII